MRHVDWVTTIILAFCALVVVIPLVAAIILGINPRAPIIGNADYHVDVKAAHPGHTVSCYEGYRLVVQYANEGRAYVWCEQITGQ